MNASPPLIEERESPAHRRNTINGFGGFSKECRLLHRVIRSSMAPVPSLPF
jgi:hypothetical protein